MFPCKNAFHKQQSYSLIELKIMPAGEDFSVHIVIGKPTTPPSPTLLWGTLTLTGTTYFGSHRSEEACESHLLSGSWAFALLNS